MMHYIPDSPTLPDETEDTGSKSSSRGQGRGRGRSKTTTTKGRTSRRGSSSRRRGSRNGSSQSRPRRKTKPAEATPITTASKSVHHKASKKLRSLITRTFAKHKPAPTSSSQDLSERDALLTVIHCPPPPPPPPPSSHRHYKENHRAGGGSAAGSTSTAGHHDIESQDSPSYYSSTSNFTDPPAAQGDHWRKLRQSVVNGEVLLQTMQGVVTDDEDDSMISTSADADEDSLTLYDPTDETPTQRAQRIQKAQDKIRQAMAVPLWQCLLAIGLYIGLTVLCFSYWLEPDWSLVESSYFAVVTFTTIGYGDVIPDTKNARLFTCVWALSGVASLGIALGVLGSNLIVVHEQYMEKAQVQRQSRVIGLFDHYQKQQEDTTTTEDTTEDTTTGYCTIEEGKRRVMFDGMEDSEDETNPRAKTPICDAQECRRLSAALFRWTLISGYIAGVLYLIAQQEGWNLSKTVYYGIITASTVGYGDFCPQSEIGRFLAILFIPVAVSVIGIFLERVANSIIDYRRNQYTNKLHNKPLTMQQIRILDSDGDGEVSMVEFLEFMLVAMNQVDQGLLDQLKQHFYRLDVDGSGTINKADLGQMAKQRLNQRLNENVTEKLRLGQYKDYLMQQAHKQQEQQGNPPPKATGGETQERSSSSSGIQKPTLQRNATQQTSNRSAGTSKTVGTSWSSYQNPPSTY